MLPRVVAGLCVTLLIYNRATTTGDVDNFRQVSEILALTFSVLAWSIPWVGGRLEEAARRQVSAKPSTRQPGSIQTLAIKSDLPSDVQVDISWISSVLLRLTNADGLVIWHDGKTICSRGILKRLQGFASGAEFVLRGLDQVWQPEAQPADGYCATKRGLGSFPSKLLPEKVLPADTEAAIVKPMPGGGHVIMWSARPRAFDKEADRSWVANAASKLGLLLNEAGDQPIQTTEEMCFEDDLPVPLEENENSTSRDPFARFDTQIRISPTVFGMIGLGVLILNRQSLVFSEASCPDPFGDATPPRAGLDQRNAQDSRHRGRGVLWVDQTLQQSTSEELLWAWSKPGDFVRGVGAARTCGAFSVPGDFLVEGLVALAACQTAAWQLPPRRSYPDPIRMFDHCLSAGQEEFLDFLPVKTQVPPVPAQHCMKQRVIRQDAVCRAQTAS
eukprot:Skav212697  [mRNA]  locus=scaffold1930:332804:336812:+ [translate_table: standard]